ncbi:hypothetical protein [Streptomyces sp. CNS654]|uniref:hypothetical protein n=1 Tax=Streptomyces sp. CNS654 TaxID=1506995 RepID=UPI0005167500|nr:hypothetical protein [Streptomyces sp. CNS654]
MARRTMALRKARAAAREQRRAELEHLLARLDRHTLLDTERPLLRTHVEQLLTTDADLRRTLAGQQALLQRQARQLDAAHAAIQEAEQDAADAREQLLAHRAVEAQRQADADTYAGRLDALRQQTGEALLAGAEEALRRALTAEVTLDRVRALHSAVAYNDRTICTDCSGYADGSPDNGPAPFPCSTIAALDRTHLTAPEPQP